MPIVVKPDANAPLSHGDILSGLACAVTNADGKLAITDSKFVLVVSRPCNALRDPHVVVAPILETKVDIKGEVKGVDGPVTLDRRRRIFAGLRDGGSFNDKFYLGNLEADPEKRYTANLAILCTLQVPDEKTARNTWVAKHRVWSMDIEFARDLHLRLFAAYSRLGFDDHRWFSDPDLNVMVDTGKREVSEAEMGLSDAKTALQEKAAQGSVPHALRDQVAKKQKLVEEAKERLAPYEHELGRRNEGQ